MKKFIPLFTAVFVLFVCTLGVIPASASDDAPFSDPYEMSGVSCEAFTNNYQAVIDFYNANYTPKKYFFIFMTARNNYYPYQYYVFGFDSPDVNISYYDNSLYFSQSYGNYVCLVSTADLVISNDGSGNQGGGTFFQIGLSSAHYVYSDFDLLDKNGDVLEASTAPKNKYEASVTGNGTTIEYSVKFLVEGNFKLTFGAYAKDNAVDEFPYTAVHSMDGTYYYDGSSVDSVGTVEGSLGTSGGKMLDYVIEQESGVKTSTQKVYNELDLNDFYDKMQDKTAYKNAENVYYTITIEDLDDNKTEYVTFTLAPDTLADTVDEEENGLFSTKKEYVSFPDINDYISTDFPNIADYVNFSAFSDIEFEDVSGFDAVLDVLKNVWYIIKAVFSFLSQSVTGFFKWLWAALKFIFTNLIGLIKYLGACLWTIIQNIGIALYNFVVDIRRLILYLFVPSSTNLTEILNDKFPAFNNIITAIKSGETNANQCTTITLFNHDFEFDFSSIPGLMKELFYNGSSICLYVIQVFLVVNCLFKCFGVNIGSSSEGGENE